MQKNGACCGAIASPGGVGRSMLEPGAAEQAIGFLGRDIGTETLECGVLGRERQDCLAGYTSGKSAFRELRKIVDRVEG